jgi:predicted permease
MAGGTFGLRGRDIFCFLGILLLSNLGYLVLRLSGEEGEFTCKWNAFFEIFKLPLLSKLLLMSPRPHTSLLFGLEFMS